MIVEKYRENEDLHEVSLDDRRETFRVARAMGLWRYSSVKLLLNSFMTGNGSLSFSIDTVNLATVEAGLKPPSPELTAYLGQAALQETADEVLEPIAHIAV